jgi:hypothetical protein
MPSPLPHLFAQLRAEAEVWARAATMSLDPVVCVPADLDADQRHQREIACC